jgi:flagellar biosynthetic protein FliQ
MMNEAIFFDTLRQALWIATVISAPVLTAALVAGLGIGLFQALTSIQEMTLTFVPKLAAIIVVYWAAMGFMSALLVSFFQDQILPLVAGG